MDQIVDPWGFIIVVALGGAECGIKQGLHTAHLGGIFSSIYSTQQLYTLYYALN